MAAANGNGESPPCGEGGWTCRRDRERTTCPEEDGPADERAFGPVAVSRIGGPAATDVFLVDDVDVQVVVAAGDDVVVAHLAVVVVVAAEGTIARNTSSARETIPEEWGWETQKVAE